MTTSSTPLSRIADKINHIRSGSPLRPGRSSTEKKRLKETLKDNAAASGGRLNISVRNTDGDDVCLREDGISSAPDIHRPGSLRTNGTASASSKQSSPTQASLTDSFDGYGGNAPDVELTTIRDAVTQPIGTSVTFRARIHTQRRISKHLDFLLFRDQTDTIQGVLSRDDPDMVKWVQHLPYESIVQITGELQKPVEDVRSANHSTIEIKVETVYLISLASHLAFSNYHPPNAMRARLDSRILDLRNPANQALFRIRAAVTRNFRRTLEDDGFLEIQTPKLQPAATESGSSVFKVNYFGRQAFLAQSPQLAKQMAISADFGRVFEIGPVFRAENSNTHRHLTEYTGLDLEMTIQHDYHELIDVVERTVRRIITTVQAMPELEEVRKRWPSTSVKLIEKTPIIPFPEGLQMLRDDGREVEEEDLSTRDEIRLGELVKEKYDTDFYFLDRFPANARPFYTHKAEDPKWTNSFDAFVRGQEICTGGQRIADPVELRRSMMAAGIAEADMKEYLAAFDLGTPPHGGAGLGLDRLVTLLLDLGDIRYGTLFHRDPKSLPARPPSLPHPEADTTKPRCGHEFPPIEELIANYGDASNTSWLDDRFRIWRHHTGAAVGWVPQGKLAMVVGDPLCDQRQYQEVALAFVDYCLRELKLTPVWMLVSEEVQYILAQHLSWRTLSCTEEQRADADRHHGGGMHEQAIRRAQRENIKLHEVKPDAAFIERANRSIEEWKASRAGNENKQIHLTEVRPWIDAKHRRYWAAEKDGKVHALVVLARLAPRHGWQVKWALDFPGAPNQTIDALVEFALSSITGPVTFGVGVSDHMTPGMHLHGPRARFLAKTYDTIVKSFGLGRKAEFRQKFGVIGEQVYICHPKHGVSLIELRDIIKFFEDKD